MKHFIAFILCLSFSFVNAQESTLKISESPEYKDKKKATGILTIHTTDQGLTGVVRRSKRNLMFDVFDSALNRKHTLIIETDKKESYVGEVVHENEIKVFTVFSPKVKERLVYCHIFNLENGTHNKKLLFEASVDKKRFLFSSRDERKTNFDISLNGKYLAIATDNTFKDVNDYAVRMFDANSLELIFMKSYQKHEDKYFQHNDILVTDNGEVFVLGKLYKDGKREKKRGEANYEFILNKITNETNKEIAITLDNQHIQNLNMTQTKGKLHLIGFYSEQRAGKIKGGCNFMIDAENFAVSSKSNYELPLDIFEDLYGDKRGTKRKGDELVNFYVDYILQDSEGNTYLLAEEFYITQVYMQNGMNGGYWQTVYHYDDIIILKFNASGHLDWGRSIFKRANGPSYNAFLKNDELHILLNSGKNLLEKKDGRTKVSRGWLESTSLYDIVYNKDGEVTYSKIQDNKGKTYYLPYYGTYQDETFIMMSDGRKKKQFMILK